MALPYRRVLPALGDSTLPAVFELVPSLVNDDPVVFARLLRERYGYRVSLPAIHPALDANVTLLSHPDDVQFVLQRNPETFRALDVPGSRDFGRVVQDSIVSLTADDGGGEWVKRLRLVNPEFTAAAAASAVSDQVGTTLATLAELADDDSPGGPVTVPDGARIRTAGGEGVRLLPAMRRLSLRLLGDTLFGPDVRAHEVAIIDAVDTLRDEFKRRQLQLVTSHVTRHVPAEIHLPARVRDAIGSDPHVALPRRHDRRVEEAIETLRTAAAAIIARRERTPLAFDDALGAWLRRPDPVTGDRVTPETLRHEVMGLLIAGHATTSAALTWAFYLLAAHPEVQERVHGEARETVLLGDLPDADAAMSEKPSPETGEEFLDAVPFTRQVWQETLRLYPALPVFGRTVAERVTLTDGETTLAPGSHVLLSPYVTHRDDAFWSEPDRFDPDRFDGGGRHEFAYYPFSGGRHACLGESLATTEAAVVLATTLATHRVEFVGDEPHDAPPVDVDSAINLQPDRDIAVRFVPRE
ncbi:cytochrome P450 [Halorarius halobius]|uniref:cytochrome P450 n=1 Tax=Halorarius halobius TaxID=2962671 RepID=UPI0020CBD088|nr:cytochrome P450 [Halorarius halobius]